MRYSDPLKLMLESTRDIWDRPETRPAVRENFLKVIHCRTAALGAEVYASETEEKLIYHSCKSRSCPSCGHRATELWQLEQLAALPNIPYVGICMTMPNVLWPFFQRNRHHLHDLPALGAAVIQQWVKVRYGARLMLMVVPHTFGRHLTFNAHLHILVSAGGLSVSDSRWIPRPRFDRRALMHMWRYAVITYLREALRTKVLATETGAAALKALLTKQYERWWSIDISHFRSKSQFLRYAGRYVRRPPIAQHRFLEISKREVRFWTKDLREKRRVETRYGIEDFVKALADHVPDRYRHAIRYFGLLAPGAKCRTSAALFLFIRQNKRPRPRRLSWRDSLRRDFGVDPLVDTHGQIMQWIARRAPIS